VIKTTAMTVAFIAALACHAAAQEARSVVAEASRVMGVKGLNSIAFAGTAAYGNIGQSRRISFGLASTTIGNFTRVIDFAHSAMHSTGVAGSPAVPGNPPPGFFEEIVTASDGWTQLEICDGMLVAYLPNEKILFAGDIDVPEAGQPPGQALLSLFQKVDRLKLDFDRYVTARPGQSVTRVELAKLAQESPE
jgi:hypothetical protein